jgi:hydroxypyruvate isomerase
MAAGTMLFGRVLDETKAGWKLYAVIRGVQANFRRPIDDACTFECADGLNIDVAMQIAKDSKQYTEVTTLSTAYLPNKKIAALITITWGIKYSP